MSDLRDQLLKAGLITEAPAPAPAPTPAPTSEPERHDEPRSGRRRRGGRDRDRSGGGERGGRGESRQVVRPAVDGPPPSDAEREEAARVAATDRVELKTLRGGRRYYYLSRDGLVPFVELADETAEQLTKGDLGLVESPEGEIWLVRREAGRRLQQLDRAWLRAFNG